MMKAALLFLAICLVVENSLGKSVKKINSKLRRNREGISGYSLTTPNRSFLFSVWKLVTDNTK